MYRVAEIINRIKETKGIATDAAFAEIMGVTRAAVLNWKTRNSIDIISIAEKFRDLDLNYIVYGVGDCQPNVNSDKTEALRTTTDHSREILHLKDKQIALLEAQLKQTNDILEYFKNRTDKLESMQFSNTETVNDTLDKERSGHGSNRTLTIEKIKNMDTPAMV